MEIKKFNQKIDLKLDWLHVVPKNDRIYWID